MNDKYGMTDKFSDPIGRLMGLRYKSHPWHGVHIGDFGPEQVTAYIEVVPTDTVKYEADDKIIAVLNNDFVYGHFTDLAEVQETIITRLRHYFLTYKDLPGKAKKCEITHVYDRQEA